MSENKYNGWANYPTWCLFMWLNEMDEDFKKGFDSPMVLKTYCADCLAKQPIDGWESDLLIWAISQVDWSELADAFKKR